MSELFDGFTRPTTLPNKPLKAKRRLSTLHLLAVSAGLIVTAMVASLAVMALFLFESEAEIKRRNLSAGIPQWTQIPNLDQDLLHQAPQDAPSGYLRGKCVLLEYNPLGRVGQLHPWHPVEDHSGIYAQTPAEVETVVWLIKTKEVLGDFGFDGIYSVSTEVFSVAIVDLIEQRVVGYWSLRGASPGEATREHAAASSGLPTETWSLTSSQLLAAIEQIPVKATTEEVLVPGHPRDANLSAQSNS